MVFNAFHGTTNPNLIFSFEYNRVAYFTDDYLIASTFAYAEDCGGLLPGEKARIIQVEITINNPLIINEDDWEETADVTNINKQQITNEGYDGIICKNSCRITYYVVFENKQVNIINRISL